MLCAFQRFLFDYLFNSCIIFSIYKPAYQSTIVENGDSSKVLHLIDDSLLEDLHDGSNIIEQPVLPLENKKKLPLQVSEKSDDDCSLLSR